MRVDSRKHAPRIGSTREGVVLMCCLFGASLLVTCLSLRAQTPVAGDSPELGKTVVAPKRRERLPEQAIAGIKGSFDASLEMRENADFLLTPALLIQEAISEGIVVTYPSE